MFRCFFAYVDARYDLNYKITAEELQYLIERAMVLRGLIEQLCEEEIVRLLKLLEG